MDPKVPRGGRDPPVTPVPSGWSERRGSWECQACPATRAVRVPRDRKVSPDSQAAMARRAHGVCLANRGPGASVAPRVPGASEDHEEPLESQGRRARLAATAPTDLRVNGACQDRRDPTASQDPKDPPAPPARTGSPGTPASEEKSASKARPAPLAPPGWWDLRELLVSLAPWGREATQAPPAPQENKGYRDHLARRAPRETLAPLAPLGRTVLPAYGVSPVSGVCLAPRVARG